MMTIPPWKLMIVLCTCLFGMWFAIPNFIPEKKLEQMPDWFPKEQVALGLDLQGGSHLLLEVDIAAGLRDRLAYVLDETRKTLRSKQIGYVQLRTDGDTVTFKLRDAADWEAALKVLKDASGEIETEYNSESERVTRKFSPQFVVEHKKNLVEQSKEIISRRVNELGTREPSIQNQGEDRIIVQLPGLQDPARAKAILGKTAKMTFRLVHAEHPYPESAGGISPPGTEIIALEESQAAEHRATRYNVYKQPFMTGESLVDAYINFHHETGEPQVGFRLDSYGARKFGETTSNHRGELIAIVLDGRVISAASINEPILGGSGVIHGKFSVKEANDLALLMRAGSLPAPLTVIEERTVGPDLGADSIAAGENATIISLLCILCFMVVVYSLFGFIATIALVFNVMFLVAGLSITGSTLTLPGIAGIALTMGMAVDANVLIFERIKEELRVGRRIISAVDAGYKRAIATIMDSNITTLIGGAALIQFGAGPIKGFGVTLSMGIVISMFTAITLTRVLVVGYLRWARPKKLPI